MLATDVAQLAAGSTMVGSGVKELKSFLEVPRSSPKEVEQVTSCNGCRGARAKPNLEERR